MTSLKSLSWAVKATAMVCCIPWLAGCSKENQPTTWSVRFEGIGTCSSPRVTDLNGDGVMDIILGAGGWEFQVSDTAVIAINGVDGKLLWRVPGRDQMVGSALLKDITGDGIDDVFIGGRSAQLLSINGASGKILWEYFADSLGNPKKAGLYNFFNPQFIPDQDHDGIDDLLIANGGDPAAPPHYPERPAGKLMVISSQSGRLLAEATVPDGKETYMSVVVARMGNDQDLTVIFGIGGETIGGNLYRTTLHDIMQQDISNALILASSPEKGFIAPVVLTDITQDGTYDIIVNAVDGRLMAINGADNTPIWQVRIPDAEAYTSPTVGFFTEDDIPDFFSNYAIGVWPHFVESVQFMVDGKNGQMMYKAKIGNFQYASPLTADFGNTGRDQVILSINMDSVRKKDYENVPINKLTVFPFGQEEPYHLGNTVLGSNFACTPWIGDLDHNGWLDIVYSTVEAENTDSPSALRLHRMATTIRADVPVHWGAYMGNAFNGIFSVKRQRHTLAKAE